METWLDTTVYQEEVFDDDYDEYFKEEMESFVDRYEKRYHTNVNNFLLISERVSSYGDWQPYAGKIGYRLIQDLDEFLESSDDIKIYVGDDKMIHFDYFDHDGANYSVIKLIPGSVEEKVYDEVGCYACELDYVEMLQKRGQLKPTKFWG